MKVYFKPNTKKLKLQVKRLIFQKTPKGSLENIRSTEPSLFQYLTRM